MKKVSYESWVTGFVERLSDYFNLAGWNIGVKFSEEEPKSGCYAENEINSAYMFSTITFYPNAKKDFEAGKMDYLVMSAVHEVVHIFLDPLHDQIHPHLSEATSPLFMKTLENQTQKLTMVFLKSLPKSVIPPR